MLQKSSARKGFCAEGWRMWRVKWYIQHAEASVLQEFPRECIFLEKVSSREDCAEDCAESLAINPTQYKKPNNQSGILLPKAYSISSAAINAFSALAICLPSLLAPPTSIVYLRSITKSPCLAYSTVCA